MNMNKWLAFLIDVPASAAISGAACAIGYGVVNALPVELAMAAAYSGGLLLLYPIMLALMYGGPIAVMANGVLKGRPGRILGPLLLAAFLVFYGHATVARDLAAAKAADTRMVEFDGNRPQMVAIEEQTIFCLSHCIQVLANSVFDLVQRPRVINGPAQ
jgi:hypothetical protein